MCRATHKHHLLTGSQNPSREIPFGPHFERGLKVAFPEGTVFNFVRYFIDGLW